jgi:outer membrane protein OmpA-like peptidoglycan-associated protein
MDTNGLFNVKSREKQDSQWISVSDMMSGLMIIFMFLAIAYMKDVVQQKYRIEKVAVLWNSTQESLYDDLTKEFKDDLPKWQAEIERESLSVRFKEPSVFFVTGSSTISQGFKKILDDFFPRYLNILRSYRGSIAEVRIEGHTSSEWEGTSGPLEAYFKNMELSQNRTRAVLQYCLALNSVKDDIDWAKENITANGLSSSKIIKLENGEENPILSRRVEFRVRTDAEKRIISILQGIRQ